MGINFGKGFFRICLVISFLGTPILFVSGLLSIPKIEKEKIRRELEQDAEDTLKSLFADSISLQPEEIIAENRRSILKSASKKIDELMANDEGIKKRVFYETIFTSSTGCLLFLIVIWAIYFSMGFIVKGFASNKKE